METTLASFFELSQKFLNALNRLPKELLQKTQADHIGYRCGDQKEFEELRALFENESAYLFQSIISGRRIAVIKLLHPLQSAIGEIRYLELADQKPDKSQVSGFDHIELYPRERTVEELVKDFSAAGFVFDKVERPHHTTYDHSLIEGFKVRLESEPLIEKIKTKEMA